MRRAVGISVSTAFFALSQFEQLNISPYGHSECLQEVKRYNSWRVSDFVNDLIVNDLIVNDLIVHII
jgi:hypothetical protein